jgi:hypothetical protein
MTGKIIFLFIVYLTIVSAKIVISSPTEVAGEYYAIIHKFINNDNFLIMNNSLVPMDPLDGCKDLQNGEELRGKIALVIEGITTFLL